MEDLEMKKLMETTIPQNFAAGLYNERNYAVGFEHTNQIIDVLFTGVTDCLADIKSKNVPTAFMFEENNKDFIAAAVVQFIENKDSENPGNWNYFWTFYKDDIPENAVKVSAADVNLGSYFAGVAQNKYQFGFSDNYALFEITRYALKVIKDWLDDNAVEGEEVGVEQEGVFEARVVVEDGQKVFSIEPAGEIKKLIKDDSAIEV